jgi:uncharacterized protein YuzB (UPF0349 family)
MNKKKQIRDQFRKKVFQRDGYQCVCCGKDGKCRQTGEFVGKDVPRWPLDAHHITNRNKFKNGGYVKENGISLCDECHEFAEYALNGEYVMGYMPDELYEMIESSFEEAQKVDERMT